MRRNLVVIRTCAMENKTGTVCDDDTVGNSGLRQVSRAMDEVCGELVNTDSITLSTDSHLKRSHYFWTPLYIQGGTNDIRVQTVITQFQGFCALHAMPIPRPIL